MTLPHLLEAIRQASEQDRAQVWAELARTENAGASKASAVLIADRTGEAIGYFFPIDTKGCLPPETTPEEEAELQRRLDTIDDTLSTEELKELIRRGGPAETEGR